MLNSGQLSTMVLLGFPLIGKTLPIFQITLIFDALSGGPRICSSQNLASQSIPDRRSLFYLLTLLSLFLKTESNSLTLAPFETKVGHENLVVGWTHLLVLLHNLDGLL